MKAKDYLKQIKKLDSLIKNKLIERQQWLDIALGITPQMSGERVQSSGNQQKMANAIDKCIDIGSEIDTYVDTLIDKKREILSVIEQLEPDKYTLLHSIYVQFMTLEDAAFAMGKSYSWSTTTHGRALKDVQTILDGGKLSDS